MVLVEEVPVHRRHRAILPGVAAAVAVVAHPLHVGAAAHIGLVLIRSAAAKVLIPRTLGSNPVVVPVNITQNQSVSCQQLPDQTAQRQDHQAIDACV